MRSRLISTGLVVIAILTLAAVPRAVDAGGKSRAGAPKKITEHLAGVIPSSWGDLVGVAGGVNHPLMVFRDEKGVIRYLQIQGVELPAKAYRIEREYE